jgi:hypothetical protein
MHVLSHLSRSFRAKRAIAQRGTFGAAGDYTDVFGHVLSFLIFGLTMITYISL